MYKHPSQIKPFLIIIREKHALRLGEKLLGKHFNRLMKRASRLKMEALFYTFAFYVEWQMLDVTTKSVDEVSSGK